MGNVFIYVTQKMHCSKTFSVHLKIHAKLPLNMKQLEKQSNPAVTKILA